MARTFSRPQGKGAQLLFPMSLSRQRATPQPIG